MASKGRSFSERFSRWQVLVHNLEESPADGSGLDEELTAIGELLAEAWSLQNRQAQLRSESQQITKRLVEVARRGDRIRSRVGAVLAGKLGPTSEELVKYGFRPHKLPPRRRRAKQEPPAGAPPAPDASGG